MKDSDVHIQVSILPPNPLPFRLLYNIEQNSLHYWSLLVIHFKQSSNTGISVQNLYTLWYKGIVGEIFVYKNHSLYHKNIFSNKVLKRGGNKLLGYA